MAVIAAGYVSARDNETGFSFGPKVGLNISTLRYSSSDVDIASKAKAGLTVGAFAEYRFNQLISASADILYSRQGGSDKYDGIKDKYRVNYLDIPILANFYVYKGLAVKAGIQPGFRMNAKYVEKDGGSKYKKKITDAFKTMDIAIPIGLSYSFDWGLIVDARYNISLNNISKLPVDNLKCHNGVFVISAGWRF